MSRRCLDAVSEMRRIYTSASVCASNNSPIASVHVCVLFFFLSPTLVTDKMLYRTVCFALDARERIGGDERVNGRRVDGDIVLSYPYVRVILEFDRSTEESPREEHHFHLAGKRSKVLMEFKQYGLDFLVKTFIDTGIENTEIKCVGFQAVRHILSNKHHLGYRRIRFRSARELHTVPCAFRSKGHL
ncbi:hypothetical protein XU18_0764 [Perkinsela sp. CCAP 1560/4]|nr:hypothetical protein XU18_0764 [Perkinsela sp. CCAP 1560/4]|eukprot:KNH08770.1 hypothetical protein XU18_0764 [Perkinsela sp. CCAP 1560/4]